MYVQELDQPPPSTRELYKESLDKRPHKEGTPHPWRWRSSTSYRVIGRGWRGLDEMRIHNIKEAIIMIMALLSMCQTLY